MIDWEWPWLFVLAPLPWLVRIVLPPYKPAAATALRFPGYDHAVAAQGESNSGQHVSVRLVAALLAWGLLLAAGAKPVWYGYPVAVPASGRDLLLAVDISDSMRVDDMIAANRSVSRLRAVKSVVADFVRLRANDRIGLILFGQHSFLQTPLTFDHETVTVQLNETLAGFAGSSTAIGDALALAVKTLRDRPAAGRVVILLTDGANTSGADPLQAARIAAQAGIRVHTIGLGATSHTTTDVTGAAVRVNPSKDLDQETLAQISTLTGGNNYRAHDPAEMAAIYQTISALEPTPQPQQLRPQRSVLHWPLAMATLIGLALLMARRDPR